MQCRYTQRVASSISSRLPSMSPRIRLSQLQVHSRCLQMIQHSSLRVGLPLILATACLSCTDSTGNRTTPNAWQQGGTAHRRSKVLADTNNITQPAQPRDDDSDFAARHRRETTLPANYQGIQKSSGTTTPNERFQLPNIPIKRYERAVPLVDRAPY